MALRWNYLALNNIYARFVNSEPVQSIFYLDESYCNSPNSTTSTVVWFDMKMTLQTTHHHPRHPIHRLPPTPKKLNQSLQESHLLTKIKQNINNNNKKNHNDSIYNNNNTNKNNNYCCLSQVWLKNFNFVNLSSKSSHPYQLLLIRK